jgi:hypothetical protein
VVSVLFSRSRLWCVAEQQSYAPHPSRIMSLYSFGPRTLRPRERRVLRAVRMRDGQAHSSSRTVRTIFPIFSFAPMRRCACWTPSVVIG